MNNKLKIIFVALIISSILAIFVYATVADLSSNSPEDEWWMISGNLTFNRYSSSNVPSNISNATVINISVGTAIGRSPIIVGDYLYFIPANSAKLMKMNASNIRTGLENSTTTYTLNYGSPTYYDGKFYIHSNGNIVSINSSNLSQSIANVNIADGIYYAVPLIFNDSVYLGDGNAAPRFKQLNISNLSHVLNTLTSINRIYESIVKNRDYFYVSETSILRQVSGSNISQTINTVSCSANGIAFNFVASDDYVYKTCAVNGVNMIQQYNATNISRVISNFSNGTSTAVLANGYLYTSVGLTAYQLNATNISHVISNFTMASSTSSSFYPLATRDYYFVAGGSTLYQLNSNNISNMISNYTAPTTISGGVVASRGFLYFGAGNFLYQLGTYNPLGTNDTTNPSTTLNSPASNYYNDTAASVELNFQCSATDNSALKNISLYLTDNLNQSFLFNSTSTLSGISSSSSWNLNLTNGNYTWNCLTFDQSNNSAFGSSNRSIMINFTDSDSDGLSDTLDRLSGNSTNVSSSGISYLNLTVNGTTTNGSLTGIQPIAFYNSSNLIVNFTYNFSSTTLYLNRINITLANNSLILNFSGQVSPLYNKTIHIYDNNFENLCLKDAEISSISDISSDCDGDDEIDLTTCINSSTMISIGTISCIDNGDTISVGNVANSALRGTPYQTASILSTEEEVEEEIIENGRASYIKEVKSTNGLALQFMSNAGVRLIKNIVDDKETGIREFEIKTKDWLTGKIEIKRYDEIPQACKINKEDFVPYRILEIDHDFENNEIDQTRLRIEVSKKWIKENKIEQVEVVRCYPKYQELRTSYINEDDNYGVYDIYSEGFSTIAILGTTEKSIVQLAPKKDWNRLVNFLIPFLLLVALIVYLLTKVLRSGVKEDLHFKNKWFDFEFKFKLRRAPHEKRNPHH
jgi:PGF-pre-PGF domain-containing protein